MTQDTILTIQYIIVGIILTGIALFLAVRIIKLRKRGVKPGSCCGCALADNCKKTQKEDCDENN